LLSWETEDKNMKQFFRLLLSVAFLSASILGNGTAYAQQATPEPLQALAFDQNLDAQVPLNLPFTDENGEQVLIGRYFGETPVILVMAYYECPMLCTLVLNGLVDSLKQMDFTPGSQMQVVTVSIDPRDTPDLAAEKKANYLADYGRPETADGWHFLVGEDPAIEALAEAVGFNYFYQEDIDQFAHPAGVVVLTPSGRVSHYFFGIQFNPTDLRLAMVESSENRIGNLVDQVYLLCYAYDPEIGGYGLVIQNVLQLAGAGTLLLMAGGFLLLIRRDRKDPPAQKGQNHD
jgi:protein SCO1